MTAVFVVRHPETTWNVAQRYQGRLDSPLSAKGRDQAEKIAMSFCPGTLDAVFSSPLTRAYYLAKRLAERTGAALSVDNRLTEMAQGPWEGLKLQDIHARHADLYRRWYTCPELVRFPGGEDLEGVSRRGQSLLSEAMARFPGGSVAIVTHSVVIQTMALAALSLDSRFLHNIRVSNCGVTTLCGVDAPGSLFTLNSTESLHDSPLASAQADGCKTWQPRRFSTT